MKSLILSLTLLLLTSTATQSQISVSQVGDTTRIDDKNIEWPCAPPFIMSVVLSSDSINIIEADTSTKHPTCSCLYQTRTKLVALVPASYVATITRQWRVPRSSGIFGDTSTIVGTIAFSISAQPTASPSISFVQPGCYGVLDKIVSTETPPMSNVLLANYPNPFNPSTIVRYSLMRRSHVTLSVFDMLGKHVITLVDKQDEAGWHEVMFSSNQLSSGIYTARMLSEGHVLSIKMLLIR